jgi:hypothetical protein
MLGLVAQKQGDANPTEAQAFEALCDHVTAVSGCVTELFGELISLIVDESLDLDLDNTNAVKVPDPPKLSKFCLPYFFDEDDTLSLGSGQKTADTK